MMEGYINRGALYSTIIMLVCLLLFTFIDKKEHKLIDFINFSFCILTPIAMFILFTTQQPIEIESKTLIHKLNPNNVETIESKFYEEHYDVKLKSGEIIRYETERVLDEIVVTNETLLKNK